LRAKTVLMPQSKFPTDRIVFFSDAVFAIAITLLIIEIKVPPPEVMAKLGAWGALANLMPLFIGFFVSFMVTALFWRAHLILCHSIKEFDNKLLWLNILLLLFVAFMPFTTAFYSEYFNSNGAFTFYCLNITAIGLISFLMTAAVIKKENLKELLGKEETAWMKVRSLITPFVFFLCIVFATFSPLLGRVSPLLIFVFRIVGEQIRKKRIAKRS
jgi:uncharacterized membrane protein